ncbi:metalloregulator ArsR/SmtB family transcription factor [Nocardiopsis sp. RSe5-2]|uniref:Metalloregulator ArsR/SmtB family transcription factor n=1 Tax=Nocardiopsis endophytica TaxID=3018445 RepID=A0ABT4TY54_9ACTN|nr:metalloregulator ArsR/SmtB family transcription factor [Nocardiopsis endophytica]MDA2809627.1 metalloregulator ArsR/SmtB family transcription factor [Nocardiopsis endophytica]
MPPTAASPAAAPPAPTDLAVERFRALGHPVRLGILRELARTPDTCACDFAEVFDVSQPTISQHLKVLREAHLVTTVRRGNQICYSLDPQAVDDLRSVLTDLSTGAPTG